MALDFCLWVFWMYLLVNSSIGSPTKKGYGYPHVPDSHNLSLEDDDDNSVMPPTFDKPSDWQPAPTPDVSHSSFDKPQPPPQMGVGRPNLPRVEGLVGGETRDWETGNPDEPLTFPLKPPQNQPDAPPMPMPSTNRRRSENPGYDAPYFAGHIAYYEPEAAQTPAPASSGSGTSNAASKKGFNTGSGAERQPQLVFEDIFHYSPANMAPYHSSEEVSKTAKGSNQPSHGGDSPHVPNPYPRWVETPSPGSEKQPKDTRTGKVNPPQRVSEPSVNPPPPPPQRVSEPAMMPPPPPLPPSSYIIQSRNGYVRTRSRMTNSRFSPEYPVNMRKATSVKSVKAPGKQAAAAGKV